MKRNYEIWQNIKDFPDYQISCFGRLKSFKRGKEKILKGGINQKGYYQAVITNGKRKTVKIHLLVIDHFGEPKPSPKHEYNHKDGDKLNCWNINLEWMTCAENINHAIKNGLCNSRLGSNHHDAKLTEQKVKEIRKLYSTGKYSQRKLAKMFDVDQTNISCIINYKTWKILCSSIVDKEKLI